MATKLPSVILLFLCGVQLSLALDVCFIVAWQKSPIISLQGVAEALASKGHRVRFATTDDDRHLVTSISSGVEFVSGGPGYDDAITPALDIISLFRGEAIYSESMFGYLYEKLKDDPPELILFDPLNVAGEALAKNFSISAFQIGGHRIDLFFLGGLDLSYPAIISGYSMSVLEASVSKRATNYALNLVCRYVLPILRGIITNPSRNRLGLASVWTEYENPYGKTKPAIIMGPFLPRKSQMDPNLEMWLNETSDPVVFTAIGTNSHWTQELADALLESFVKNQEKFRVVLTIKKKFQHMLNQEIVNTLKKNEKLYVISFVDQFAVLQHRNIKAFVTHSGLSSAQEGLAAGVPMLAIPMMLDSDQPTIAARLLEIGTALTIDRSVSPFKEGVSGQNITDKLLKLLNDPSYREKSEYYSNVIKHMDAPFKTAQLVEDLIKLDLPAIWKTGNSDMGFIAKNAIDVHLCCLATIFIFLYAVWKSFVFCCFRSRRKAIEKLKPN